MKIAFFGSKGWIASYFLPLLQAQGHEVLEPRMRADDTSAVISFLEEVKPERVIAFVGRTHGEGIPTIDYLEQPGKLVENVRDNLYAPLSLAMLCKEKGIHYTYLGTGCIFSDMDPTLKKYVEGDDPNFFGSSYSVVKGFTDRLMKLVNDNTLNVRIRMPITPDFSPRNFITKIVRYAKVCSVPNSMTVLPSLLPVLLDMVEKGRTGTVNLVNPGILSHNEILELYKEVVDPTKTWENFSVEEQDAILLSKRSNNQLDTTLLETWYPNTPCLRDAVLQCLRRMKDATV